MAKVDKDAEVRDLRRENADLRRTVARLRKALERRGSFDDEPEDDGVPATATPTVVPNIKCPKCGSTDQRLIATPSSKILICAACKNRRRVV